jgi:hypothetical protein
MFQKTGNIELISGLFSVTAYYNYLTVLLKKFSIHPNPVLLKLILCDIELFIITHPRSVKIDDVVLGRVKRF